MIYPLILVVIMLVACGAPPQEDAAKDGNATATEEAAPPPLPQHKFSPAKQEGRAQIRAVIPKATYSQESIEQIAVELAKQYEPDFFLVQFFDDESCLQDWDGSGLLRDSDWPHWLCRVRVDKDGVAFQLAKDWDTGLTRTDVLKE